MRVPSAPAIPKRLVVEWALSLALVSGAGCAAWMGWRYYEGAILPHVEAPAVPAPPPATRMDDRQAVKRFQRVREFIGEAVTYHNAHRQDWADASLAEALRLDPENVTALALRARWAAEPARPQPPEEQAAREKEQRIAELLGAALSMEAAGQRAIARAYIQEGLALDPGNQSLAAALTRLTR